MRRPEIVSPEQIQEMAQAFQKSRVLLTAFELDLFTALGDETLASADAAGRIGVDARACDRLMNALTALGLLEKKGGLFAATAAARRFLSLASPDCMTGLSHTNNTFTSWATLTRAVQAGTRVVERPANDASNTRAFIEAMHRRARGSADALAAKVGLEGVARVLDVGGGSGVYSMAFCRAKEGLTCTVLDLPHVTPLTRRYVAEAGLSGRIGTLDGDYHVADFGAGYDLVFLSAIVHINGPTENADLIRRSADALNAGGRVAVADFVMDEDRAAPQAGALFALNMLVNTERGDTYTEQEIAGWMRDAGLVPCAGVPLGGPLRLVAGTKP